MATPCHHVSPLTPRPNPATATSRHHLQHLHHQLTSATSLTQLTQLHAQILRSNLPVSSTSLLLHTLSLSSSSYSLSYSLSVFTLIPKRKTNLSNKLLREFSNSREPYNTLLAYQKLRREGLGKDKFCFPALLKAVLRAKAVIEGMEIHGLAVKLGFVDDTFVETGLVRMYAGCGRILDARGVFDKMSHRDVVTWSVMIDGYIQVGLFDDVLALFEAMTSSNVEPDELIFSSIISACSHARNLSCGKAIHKFITQNGMVADPHLQSALVYMYGSCGSMQLAQNLYDQLSTKDVVVSTAMISGYSKNGQVEAARLIFDQMTGKDLVCWSAMISSYAESEKPLEALELFNQMQVRRIKPDKVTILNVISACTHLGTLKHAKWIHEYVDRHGFGDALHVNNALIDMYAKCGSLEEARVVFDRMPRKNVVTWTSMITALAIHGEVANALKLFYRLKNENIELNGVTFVSVLYACSHSGLVDEGRKIFASMVEEYNITPKLEHYGCMIDLLGRANLLREAFEIVEQMPMEPNVVIWGSLVAACRFHNEFELGKNAAKRLLELDPDHDGAHVLLSTIFAKKRRWEDVREARILMKQKCASKEKGCSRIELNNEVHEFLTGARNHEQADEIYAKLNEVVGELKQVGYAPNTCNVLVDLDEDEKEKAVLWHGEKLALCYGLLREEKGSCIRIVKNLRICEDCHTFMKLVSKVYQKNIIVRDRTRFHHCKDGLCSCKDVW